MIGPAPVAALIAAAFVSGMGQALAGCGVARFGIETTSLGCFAAIVVPTAAVLCVREVRALRSSERQPATRRLSSSPACPDRAAGAPGSFDRTFLLGRGENPASFASAYPIRSARDRI